MHVPAVGRFVQVAHQFHDDPLIDTVTRHVADEAVTQNMPALARLVVERAVRITFRRRIASF